MSQFPGQTVDGKWKTAPAGFDQRNWDDPQMRTVKYDAGRMLVGKTKPSDVAAVVRGGDFQQRFPGATFDGKDKVDFKGALSEGDRGTPVGIIDVLLAADQGADTSNGLWWGHEPDGGPAPASAATTTPSAVTPNAVTPMSPAMPWQTSDLMAQILESLQMPQADVDPQALLQQVLR